MKNKNKISFGVLILFLLLMWSSIGFGATSYRPNRASTAGSSTAHETSDGSDHGFIDQDVTSGSSPTFGDIVGNSFDVNSGKITELGDATEPTDAANLKVVQEFAGITRFFYLGSKTLDQIFTNGSDDYYEETQDSQNDDILTNIYFVATEADTLAPMTLKVGTFIDFVFKAKVLATAGKGDVTIYLNFGYVDADGSSNFVKVGASSDSTSILTTTSTLYNLHIDVVADTTIPITKRFYVQVVMNSSNTTYTDLWFYYDESAYHVDFSVSASILENFLTTTFKTVEKSADAVALTADECKSTLITNKGWDGADDQTFTFSEADTDEANGLRCKILMAVTDADNDFYLDTEGNTTQFYLNGIPLGDGVRIVLENPTIGESIVCHTATLDGTTYDLYCDAINGAWVDKGS